MTISLARADGSTGEISFGAVLSQDTPGAPVEGILGS